MTKDSSVIVYSFNPFVNFFYSQLQNMIVLYEFFLFSVDLEVLWTKCIYVSCFGWCGDTIEKYQWSFHVSSSHICFNGLSNWILRKRHFAGSHFGRPQSSPGEGRERSYGPPASGLPSPPPQPLLCVRWMSRLTPSGLPHRPTEHDRSPHCHGWLPRALNPSVENAPPMGHPFLVIDLFL